MYQGKGGMRKSILGHENSVCRGPGECGFLQSREEACEATARGEGPPLAARA